MSELADIAATYAGIALLVLLCLVLGGVCLWRAVNKLDKMNISNPWQ